MAADSVSAGLSSTGTILKTPGIASSSVKTTLMTDFLFPVVGPPSLEVRLRLVLEALKLLTSFSFKTPDFAEFCVDGSAPPASNLPEP